MMRSSRLAAWVPVVLIAIGASIFVIRAVDQSKDGTTGSDLALGLAVIALVLAAFAFLGLCQFRVLSRAYPAALIFSIVMYRELAPQLVRASSMSTHFDLNIRNGMHAAVVVDDDAIRFFKGFLKPNLFFSMPTELLRSTTLRKVPQGKWNLTTLEMSFSDNAVEAVINLSIVRSGFTVPIIVGRRTAQILSDAVSSYSTSGDVPAG